MSNFASNPGNYPASAVDIANRTLAMMGRTGGSEVIVTPPLAAAIAAGAAVESQPQQVLFKEPGYVIAIQGQELAGTAAKFASTEIRVQVGASRDVFSDGRTGQFVPMLVLFGGVQNWFTLNRYVTPAEPWYVTYRNRDAGATATPFSCFLFLSLRALGQGGPQKGR